MISGNLSGVKILVTRPVHQADSLCRLIEEVYGGIAIRLPVIAIADIENNHALRECSIRLNTFDIAIFISANAIIKAVPTLLFYNQLPLSLTVIAIGKRTAEVLRQRGISAICPESPYNSEALLAMPELQAVEGKKVVIFRGEGGRELLAETLSKRGAIVQYVNVYRRVKPVVPSWIKQMRTDIIIATSNEGLHNLFSMFVDQPWIKNTPLVVIGDRMRTEALQLEVHAPILVAPAATDEGLIAAVLQWNVAHRMNVLHSN